MTTAQVMIRILHLILALSLALAQKETEKKKSWAVKGTGYQIRNLDVAVRAGFGYGATHLRKLYSGCHFCQRCKLRRCSYREWTYVVRGLRNRRMYCTIKKKLHSVHADYFEIRGWAGSFVSFQTTSPGYMMRPRRVAPLCASHILPPGSMSFSVATCLVTVSHHQYATSCITSQVGDRELLFLKSFERRS